MLKLEHALHWGAVRLTQSGAHPTAEFLRHLVGGGHGWGVAFQKQAHQGEEPPHNAQLTVIVI